MATMKSSLTSKVPSPKNQGGHSSSDATTQKTSIQKKSGPVGTGSSNVLYSKAAFRYQGNWYNCWKANEVIVITLMSRVGYLHA